MPAADSSLLYSPLHVTQNTGTLVTMSELLRINSTGHHNYTAHVTVTKHKVSTEQDCNQTIAILYHQYNFKVL